LRGFYFLVYLGPFLFLPGIVVSLHVPSCILSPYSLSDVSTLTYQINNHKYLSTWNKTIWAIIPHPSIILLLTGYTYSACV